MDFSVEDKGLITVTRPQFNTDLLKPGVAVSVIKVSGCVASGLNNREMCLVVACNPLELELVGIGSTVPCWASDDDEAMKSSELIRFKLYIQDLTYYTIRLLKEDK